MGLSKGMFIGCRRWGGVPGGWKGRGEGICAGGIFAAIAGVGADLQWLAGNLTGAWE
jgi:hypothetical protein